MKKKIIRITTVSGSLRDLLQGQLKFMSNYFDMVAISSSGGSSWRNLYKYGETEGVKTIPIEMTRKITPIKDIIAVYKLYKVLRKEKPDIVHTHTPKAGTLGMLAAKLAGVPYRLHTIAGLPLLVATGKKRILLNFVEKVTYACASKIYPNSNGLKQIILDLKFTTEDKLKVIANGSSNGINVSGFNPKDYNDTFRENLKNELGIQPQDFVFLFVGRLVADKGINELIAAFDTLCKSNIKNIKLLLVGSYEEELDPLNEDTLDIINTNKNIISSGWVNDVRPYYTVSNVLTFPSYREGFPNVVMQAGAMGLPCIVTNINGCNEIIIEGENGAIIPVKNKEILRLKMLEFSKEEVTFNSNKCRDLIVSRYSREFVWNALLEEYNKLLSEQ